MIWHSIDVAHARKHNVQAYLRQDGAKIEAFHACEALRVCHMAHFVLGQIGDIRYDQDGTSVTWRQVKLPAYCNHPEVDCRHNDFVTGHEPKIADLKYGIANMMNQAFSDSGFSRYAKKLLLGQWECRTSNISFYEDGSYRAEGEFADIGRGLPPCGVWSLGRNQLVLLDSQRNGGIRTQLVEIDTTNLLFHGRENYLFHKYKRK